MKNTGESPSPVQQSDGEKKSKGNAIGGQVHHILMDEFKKAHQKMFKNGYVENEYQQPVEETKITALDKNDCKHEVSRWKTISGIHSIHDGAHIESR